ncbi:DUF2249 domain-containing protein [Actinoplanes teichomyceticus]|uniref:Uncharacterized protein (DUF2249 family) n=1 Tax=Actinoplanes teichomyceticus TaxID=1867 RepID=A0A561VMT8_ACTTI|nr:DUF2249 domain-containing protein [Actinoplanes teichomyceticus]TWG12934.1 uncharacterized protein (DUF2249 family) [Actinoplanes teichomyceticus]GIF13688.1 hypothetical protein Ate01nite_37200 [Actinoplanes teichomyceticus]
MSPSDEVAAAAVVRHHAQMATELDRLVRDLIRTAEIGGLRQIWQAREALVGWLTGELLPHANAEEAALYPAASGQPGAGLLITGMLAEHRAIGTLVTELTETASPVQAAAAARALQALFEVHLAKENDLVVPVLVGAPDVDLAALLDGMHDLLGVEPADGCGCGGCGCGGDAPQAAAPAATLSIDPRIDVRDLPHAERHARVMAALGDLAPDSALVLVAPHAPLPLLSQIDERYAGQFTTEWLQSGPDVWQLRLHRVAVPA